MIVVRTRRVVDSRRAIPQLEAALLGAARQGHRRSSWRPPIEVFECESGLELVVEVAGMDADDFEIEVHGERVSIHGDRPDPMPQSQRLYHVANIDYGPFYLDIPLPFSVNRDDTTATYENGFLRISLPRERGRTIRPTSISVGSGQDQSENDQ